MHKAKGKHSLTDPWPHQTEQMLCQLEASTKPPMPQGKVGVGGVQCMLKKGNSVKHVQNFQRASWVWVLENVV